jgi:hypothetical protein
MIARNHILKIEFIEKAVLPTYRLTHHRFDPLTESLTQGNHVEPHRSKDFFNTLGYKQPSRSASSKPGGTTPPWHSRIGCSASWSGSASEPEGGREYRKTGLFDRMLSFEVEMPGTERVLH